MTALASDGWRAAVGKLQKSFPPLSARKAGASFILSLPLPSQALIVVSYG